MTLSDEPNPLYRLEQIVIPGFKVLDGNVDKMNDAKIFCLGEDHTNPYYNIAYVEFVNQYAQEGDIVLVESIAAGLEVDGKKHRDTKYVTKPVRVIGWDNIELLEQARKNVQVLVELNTQIEKVRNEQHEVPSGLDKRFWELQSKTDQIAIVERNKSLFATIGSIRKQYPTQRMFIFAGDAHFSDPTFITRLARSQQYLTIIPEAK